jgi:glycosyltransferase involved in cell wall biosynthesis
MKLLVVDDERGWRGGQDSVFHLLQGLAEREVAFTLASAAGGELGQRAAAKGWPCRPWRAGGELSTGTARFLAGLFDELQPDVVLYNTPHPVTAGIYAAAHTGVHPARVVARRVDFPLRDNPFSKWKYRRGADHFLAISRSVADTLVRGGIPPERITVVHEGIQPAEVELTDPAAGARPPVVGMVFACVAALTLEKGVDVLLEAFALHRRTFPGSGLLVVGDGPEAPRLKPHADRLDCGAAVRFLGFREDFIAVLKAADALVMPSRSEGFGRVALYAMAAGRPVIGTAVGGIPEVVADGETGFLTAPGDPSALAAALDRLAADPAAAAALGRRGQERLHAEFTVDHMVAGTLVVFKKVLAMQSKSCEDSGPTPKSEEVP